MMIVGAVAVFLAGAICSRWVIACTERLPHVDADAPWKQWKVLCEKDWWTRASKYHPLLDRLPIFGWMRVRRYAKPLGKKIPRSYSAWEIANGLVFVAIYLAETSLWDSINPYAGEKAPPGVAPPALDSLMLHLRIFWHLLLVQCLLAASAVDAKYTIIPDGITVPAMIAGLLGAVLAGTFWLVPVWFQEPSLASYIVQRLPGWLGWMENLLLSDALPADVATRPHLHGLAVSAFGLAIGGGSVLLLRAVAGRALGQEAMGMGDVTLMAAVGAFLGWQAAVMITIVFAPLLALIALILWPRLLSKSIPFGPYLAAATVLMMIFWPAMWAVGARFFSLGPIIFPVAIGMTVLLFGLLILIRGFKRAMGWADAEGTGWYFEEVPFGAAEQNLYVTCERDDDRAGNPMHTEPWPGEESGRGTAGYSEWKYGD